MLACIWLCSAGIPIDGKTVFTSDHALKLEWLPQWIAIIGSGYIGLEFSDVYTALGCEVTFIEVRTSMPLRCDCCHARAVPVLCVATCNSGKRCPAVKPRSHVTMIPC